MMMNNMMQGKMNPSFIKPPSQPAQEANPTMQVATELPPTPQKPANGIDPDSPLVANRKCRDLICLIIFTAFWGLCLALIITQNMFGNLSRMTVIIEPHDFMRRRCGYNSSATYQLDTLATDYSDVVTSATYFEGFCDLAKLAYGSEPNASWLSSTTCNTLYTAATGAETDAARIARTKPGRVFFTKMNQFNRGQVLNRETTPTLRAAISFDGHTVCVDQADLKLTATSAFCNPPVTAKYVCAADVDIFYSKITGKTAFGTQFLTQTQYDMINGLEAKYQWLTNMCFKLPEYTPTNGTIRADFSNDLVASQIDPNIMRCGKFYLDLGSTVATITKTFDISQYLSDFSRNFISEITNYWRVIVYGVLAALGLMIVYLVFLRFFIGIMIWTCIIAIVAGGGYGCYFFASQAATLEAQSAVKLETFGYPDQAKLNTAYGDKWIAGVLGVIAGIVLLIAIICNKSIRIAIAVFQQSMACIGKIPIVFVFPFFAIIFVVLHLVWSVPFAYMVYLMGTYDAQINAFSFETVQWDADQFIQRITNWSQTGYFFAAVFGVIWGVFFFYNMLEFAISAMVVQWYFNRDKTFKGMKGSTKRMCGIVMKQMGTVCVTSFIVSFVVLIRFIFEYMLKRMERGNQIANSKVVKAAVWFTRCCLAVLQKIVQWINRNVQVYAAISGEGYCKSIIGAVKLLMAKFATTAITKGLSSFFLFLGKILVTLAGIAVAGILAYYADSANPSIKLAPPLVAGVASFLLSFYVIEIVKLVIDTIFMCFLYEDTILASDREKGKEPYAPGDLIKLLTDK